MDMTRIAADSHVTLHYRLAAQVDGNEREVISTLGGRPATLQLGSGQLAASLERCLVGLKEGEEAAFDIAAAEAFGERSADMVQSIARATFDAHADPEVEYTAGDLIEFNRPGGGRLAGVVKQRNERRVIVDFNHPLAGLPVRFSVHVIGVL